MMGYLSSKTKILLKWLDTNAGMLARIEALVVISAGLMTFLALFGSYRRRSRSSVIKYTLLAAYILTDSISAYTIGLMQTANFHNELFVLWSTFLIIARCITNSIIVINIKDIDNWLSNMLNIGLLVVYTLFIYNSYAKWTSIWIAVAIFMAISMVKFLERFVVFYQVRKPNGYMVNTKLVSDYMHYEHKLSNEQETDPVLMKGYKYLVCGEKEKDVRVGPPDYLMKLNIEDAKVADKVVTLESIWSCRGPVLSESEVVRDVCLSFTLFKLLRRRFTGYPWAEANLPKARNLIVQGLLGDPMRTFRVIETELAFLYDSFYTKYAVVSHMPVMLLSSVASLVGSFWVAVILAHYKPPSYEEHLMRGIVDSLVTISFLSAIAFIELWQIITYVFSDWAKVLLLCNYVRKSSWQGMNLFQTALSFLCQQRVLKPWDGKLGQYSLLESYDYYPSCFKMVVMNVQRGQEASPFIQLPEEVKKAIVQSLINSRGRLSRIGQYSLTLCEVGCGGELSWACELETYTQIILVWHVATSICLLKTGAPPHHASTEDQFNHKVADSLSKYCAYLVVFCREFLPDQDSVTEVIFARIVHEAMRLLWEQRSMDRKLDKLMEVRDATETIVEKGGKLGRQLIELIGDESLRFRVLRKIWVEITLCIAPSSNVTAHARHLAEGGEFITHVWALLCHLGIFQQPPAREIV
ncbi:hypothetical protein IHE45_15G115400 [Dioscorea alata]|uniref:Uncharacterized protein n=1 Tax=Dioscorea alata TaxID=55571 RepID=A0ACB7UNW7_DIOAL|nr:hypothetical protein IHE45_15G115400 [Dioscorea alata]